MHEMLTKHPDITQDKTLKAYSNGRQYDTYIGRGQYYALLVETLISILPSYLLIWLCACRFILEDKPFPTNMQM